MVALARPKGCPSYLDLKCVDCSECGKELVGPFHSSYAPFFGMESALWVGCRPSCPCCVADRMHRLVAGISGPRVTGGKLCDRQTAKL